MDREPVVYFGHFVFGPISTECSDSYPELTLEMIKYVKYLLKEEGLLKEEE